MRLSAARSQGEGVRTDSHSSGSVSNASDTLAHIHTVIYSLLTGPPPTKATHLRKYGL